jgi:predicted O-linked N-acetylglucosamine transferase (SPINDLY family)
LAATSLTDAARAALRRGDDIGAEALCRRALEHDAADAAAWTLLGTALRRRDAEGAEAALRRAIAGDPASADAPFHLANLLREQGRLSDAIELYRQALRRIPDHPSVLNNLGLALAARGDDVAAEGAWRKVLDRHSTHKQALANVVHLLCRQHRHAEATVLGDRYVDHYDDAPAEFWIDRGIGRHAADDLDGAVACFEHALRIAPGDATALANLGTVLIHMSRFDDAVSTLARAHDAAPADLHVLGLLAHAQAHCCRWDEIASLHETIAKSLERDPEAGIHPFHALAMPLSAALQRQCARHWAASLPLRPAAAPAVIAERGTRLRVGYVSSDFREHALSYLATEVWERHDRGRLATFAYAIGIPEDSPLRHRVRAAFETFRDCAGVSAGRVAQRIRGDAIDIRRTAEAA